MAQDPQIQDQTGPGWDSPGAAGTTSGPVSKNGGFVDDVKLYWRQIMDTSILAPVQGLFNSADETGQQIVKNELDHAHPVRAALAKGYFEVQKDVTDLLSGLTTPTNIALGIVSGGESAAAKAVATVSGLYFGWRGSQQMLAGRQAGETQADEIRRRAFGALQTVAGGAGAVTGGVSAKEALRSSIQNNLGLSGELAAKVQAKVELAQEAQQAAEGAPSSPNELVHGTTPENAAKIQASGKFVPPPNGPGRNYSYSDFGPNAIYVAPRNSWWMNDQEATAGRAQAYQTKLPVQLSPEAKVFEVNNAADATKLAKIAGFNNVQDFSKAMAVDNLDLTDPASVADAASARAVTDKLQASGIDAIKVGPNVLDEAAISSTEAKIRAKEAELKKVGFDLNQPWDKYPKDYQQLQSKLSDLTKAVPFAPDQVAVLNHEVLTLKSGKLAQVTANAKAQADAVQAVGQGTAASAAAQTPIELNKIIDQATHEVATRQAYFDTEYGKLNAQAKAPVTTAEDLKSEIINSIKARGVQDAEIAKIQNKIFIALPGNPTLDRLATKAETNASDLATVLSTGGMNLETIRKTLANQAYQPQQIDKAISIAFPELKAPAGADVSFDMSRRVKNDLWDAAQSATDIEMRNGLYDALANVDGMRQRYADAQGFGPQHTKLNTEYMKFKREIGSGMVDELTKAANFQDQNTILLTAKNLINQDSGEALRKLLDLHGIDTTPLKAALDEHKAFAPLPEQALPEIIKQAEAQSKQIEATKNQAVTTIGETNPIIPGKSDLALAGKGNLQIRLDAMRAIADNAKKSGITNAGAYIQILWGTARLLSGSPFGGFSAASGGTRLALEKMLRSKGFQDYVAQESGVTAEAMPKFRRTLAKSYPYLEKIALSTVAAGGLNQANQKKSQPLVMPPPAPAKTSGNITIAGSQ